MDDAFEMSGYNPDAMDKIIQADGGQLVFISSMSRSQKSQLAERNGHNLPNSAKNNMLFQ